MAEGAGKITRDLREELLGHYGGIAARYHVGKAWGADLLKDARASYKRAELFLNTVQVRGAEDVVTEMRRTILLDLRYTPEELNQIDLAQLDHAEFQALIAKKRAGAAAGSGASARKQKIVNPGELAAYLDGGWTVVMQINGQVVVNPPSS
ncbi:integrase/recombinase [mine drainage metagenome]|uniref:Integrase/recombinase n=1 Tax=mine drainage metagenome TaxID=410659 RepID=T0ZIR8_9ZZZZ